MATLARSLPARGVLALALVLFSLAFSACGSKKDGTSADIEAINKLHQQDVEASRKLDVDALASLWSDDIVTLSEGEPPLIGKDANRASIAKLRDATRDLEITDYNVSLNEVKIVGDWAFEWGTYSGSVKPPGAQESLRSTGKVIRVLKKESNGSWRIARAMYNSDAEAD